MGVIKIREGIYSVGVLNPGLRLFDVIMKTEYGTSYNAYLLTGEKNVLIETVHARYFDEYVENVQSIVDLSKIDYIVMNHNEPDHSGSLARLLDLAPNAQLLATPAGRIYLPLITNKPMPAMRAVQDGETLELGGGRTLRFIHAPFLHWPDTMFTYLESEKTVFTCDFLGAHFCEPTMSDLKLQYRSAYERALEEYFDAIFSPFKPYVLSGLSKLDALDAETVCTSHGPILHKNGFLEDVRRRYAKWSTREPRQQKDIPIFYCSAYGNTAALAARIAEGIKSVIKDAAVELYDLTVSDPCSLTGRMNAADAFLLGTPTINKDALLPVWQLVNSIDAISAKGRPVSVFGSYGWSGEGVPAVISRLKGLNMNVFEEGYRCRFVPSDAELQAAFEFGARFATALG
ncbi:Flavorubredoxin [Sporobacter termitidis DSM 10068]|uniref:Flavorubredoxin n=1 Tax=Sporobacter termitidis DSM 10068 TaxID=1123282 RepID=A0A1M5UDA4_9FIRM|nr:FprA family A-type flavoprotein [Sporobacter termitidis]SHH61045.1 Flavorubredoxin [Sporobacter termitidis DSM 10068]